MKFQNIFEQLLECCCKILQKGGNKKTADAFAMFMQSHAQTVLHNIETNAYIFQQSYAQSSTKKNLQHIYEDPSLK